MRRIAIIAFGMLMVVSSSAQSLFTYLDNDTRSSSLGACSLLNSSAYHPLNGYKAEFNASCTNYNMFRIDGLYGINEKLYFNAEAFNVKMGVSEYYDDYGNSTGKSYNPSCFFASAGIGYMIRKWLSVGLRGAYINENIGDANQIKVFSGELSLAAKYKDLSGVIAYNTIPGHVSSAIQYSATLKEKSRIKAMAQYRYYTAGASQFGAGIEYGYDDCAFLRLGYFNGGNGPIPSSVSIGVGTKIKFFTLNFTCTLPSENSGEILRFSSGIRF